MEQSVGWMSGWVRNLLMDSLAARIHPNSRSPLATPFHKFSSLSHLVPFPLSVLPLRRSPAFSSSLSSPFHTFPIASRLFAKKTFEKLRVHSHPPQFFHGTLRLTKSLSFIITQTKKKKRKKKKTKKRKEILWIVMRFDKSFYPFGQKWSKVFCPSSARLFLIFFFYFSLSPNGSRWRIDASAFVICHVTLPCLVSINNIYIRICI